MDMVPIVIGRLMFVEHQSTSGTKIETAGTICNSIIADFSD
jgi:hypothetical protein